MKLKKPKESLAISQSTPNPEARTDAFDRPFVRVRTMGGYLNDYSVKNGHEYIVEHKVGQAAEVVCDVKNIL